MFRILVRLFGAAIVVAGTSVVGFMLLKSASHNRNWQTVYARLPSASFDGGYVTIRNIRNFVYHPDGTVKQARYDDRTYDLGRLTELWYGISHFYDYGLAHTFLSFGFEDGARLVVSIEARQENLNSHPAYGDLPTAQEPTWLSI